MGEKYGLGQAERLRESELSLANLPSILNARNVADTAPCQAIEALVKVIAIVWRPMIR